MHFFDRSNLRNILRVHRAELGVSAKSTITTWYSTALHFPPSTWVASLWLAHLSRSAKYPIDVLAVAFRSRIGIRPGLRRSRSSTIVHRPLFREDLRARNYLHHV